MRYLRSSLLCLVLGPALTAADEDVPKGCDFGVSATADATMSCYQDLDRDGDGSLSREELDRLPRTRGRFDEMNEDGAGGVTPDEFQNGIESLLQRYGGKGV